MLILGLVYRLTKLKVIKTIIIILMWLWLIELFFCIGILIGVGPDLKIIIIDLINQLEF